MSAALLGNQGRAELGEYLQGVAGDLAGSDGGRMNLKRLGGLCCMLAGWGTVCYFVFTPFVPAMTMSIIGGAVIGLLAGPWVMGE